jgi:hypothetical protein
MKTERRHELQTNELADYLGKQYVRLQPHAKTIAFGALAVVAAVVAYLYFSSQQSTKAGAGWSDFIKAVGNRDVTGLTEVAKLHAGTPAGAWALQAAADIKLASGAVTLYSDRKEAERNLKEAEAQFRLLEQEAAQNPMLLERAQFGLAQVYESLSEVEKARTYYDKVAQGKSALGQAAKKRSEQLSSDSVVGWYRWFERQEPVKRTPPGDKPAPKISGDLNVLPERPDLPQPSGELFKDADNPEAEQPAPPEKPAAQPETKPAEPAATTAPAAPPAPAEQAKPSAGEAK